MNTKSIDKAARAREIRRMLESERLKSAKYQDMQRLLSRYAAERFLNRVSASPHSGKFVLRGGFALPLYLPEDYRPTRGCDLVLSDRLTRPSLTGMLQTICAIKQDDGLTFRAGKIEVREITSPQKRPGYEVTVPAMLESSSCTVHVTISFCEVITPALSSPAYPSLLKMPRPRLKICPIETVIAEKFHAIVQFGLSCTRMQDYYDLAEIARSSSFSASGVQLAMEATFEQRKTAIPHEIPEGLTAAFYDAKTKQEEWKSFLKRHGLSKGMDLETACKRIEKAVMAIL